MRLHMVPLLQLQTTAGSLELHHDEYRELNLKCWAKFYGCCYQYHQLLSLPLGLSQDPGTGMGLLLKTGMMSFLWPDCLLRCTFNGQELEGVCFDQQTYCIIFLCFVSYSAEQGGDCSSGLCERDCSTGT